MLLHDIKENLKYKLTGAKNLPSDKTLSKYFIEAIYYISSKCNPIKLLRLSDSTDLVLRKLEDGKFIAVPTTPDFENSTQELDLDEDLTYSAINYVCFLISTDPKFKALADDAIFDYQSNYGRDLEYLEMYQGD